jgi:hypothetical protein
MIRKQNSDPFLVQVTVMLVILLVVFFIGDEPSNLNHLLVAAR